MHQPNIVFILIDDMGWMDLSCQGSTFYETPNIDRLASEGILFSDAYAACPVCSPTRASIMSGKYPARIGLTHFIGGGSHCKAGSERGRLLNAPYVPFLSTEEKSLASAFKQHGYATWHLGKWHLGGEAYWPDRHGFDINLGGCHMGHPSGEGHYFPPWQIPTLDQKEGDGYLTDRLGDEAARLIGESDGTPFFMNMWFYSVHTPIQAKPEKIAKYEAKARAVGLESVNALVEGDYFPAEHKKTKRLQRRIVQSDPTYAAMIESLDENVGKILAALEEKGIADDTIVIFTSDNGGLSTAEGSPTCNAPLSEGKGWMQEGGVREPMLLRWPARVSPGQVTDAIVTSPDFYPTLLEACGLPLSPEQHVDGKSFLSVLDGGESFDRGAVFWHYPHYGNQGGTPGCSIREGAWKLIEFFEGEIELYNLKDDLGEAHNLSASEPARVKELLTKLHAWQQEVGAINPAPNPDWKPWLDADLNPLD
ncbi:MAG: sulfatase [Verrucomicrobia bacterium]|nr:sulfatase [Verrucomicrobiota bacterium]